MADLRFEWDATKGRANLRKHGISFEEAETAFSDDFALVVADPDHSAAGEERFLLIGHSAVLRVLLVVHSEAEGGAVIRLISAHLGSPSNPV